MSRTRRGPPFWGLCIVLFFAISGCSDNPEFRENGDDVGGSVPGEDAGPGGGSDAVDQTDTTDSPDATDRPDASPGAGFQLRGELAPTGGLSMSNGYTLSGRLSPGTSGRTSSSANFSLTITPVISQTSP